MYRLIICVQNFHNSECEKMTAREKNIKEEEWKYKDLAYSAHVIHLITSVS